MNIIHETTENKGTASEFASQRITPKVLHQASSKELVRPERNSYSENFVFSANAFYSHQSQSSRNITSDLWVSQLNSRIQRGAHHNECQYAHNVKLLAKRAYSIGFEKDLIKMASLITNNFTQVRTLELTCSYGETGKNMFPILGSQLGRRLTNLRNLSLVLESREKITNESLHAFMKEICKNLVNLKSLNFVFNMFLCHSAITDEGAKAIASEINKWLMGLKFLDIDFSNCAGVSSQAVQLFITRTTRLRKLEKLKFRFLNQTVSEEILATFIHSICRNFTCLKRLEFAFGYANDILLKSLWFILAEITQNLVHLEHLNFTFSSYDTETLEEHTTYTLNQLPSLKSLELKLNWDATSEPVLVSLVSTITHTFVNLEQLTIKFGRTDEKFSKATFEALVFKTSRSLTNLKDLSLDFSRCLVQQDGWEKWLDLENEKPLLTLKHLSLVFFKCGKLPVKFLEVLGTRIAFYLYDLQSLNLNFFSNQGSQDEGIMMLGERISESLLNLKTIQIIISFRNSDCIEPLKKMFHYVPDLQIMEI